MRGKWQNSFLQHIIFHLPSSSYYEQQGSSKAIHSPGIIMCLFLSPHMICNNTHFLLPFHSSLVIVIIKLHTDTTLLQPISLPDQYLGEDDLEEEGSLSEWASPPKPQLPPSRFKENTQPRVDQEERRKEKKSATLVKANERSGLIHQQKAPPRPSSASFLTNTGRAGIKEDNFLRPASAAEGGYRESAGAAGRGRRKGSSAADPPSIASKPRFVTSTRNGTRSKAESEVSQAKGHKHCCPALSHGPILYPSLFQQKRTKGPAAVDSSTRQEKKRIEQELLSSDGEEEEDKDEITAEQAKGGDVELRKAQQEFKDIIDRLR